MLRDGQNTRNMNDIFAFAVTGCLQVFFFGGDDLRVRLDVGQFRKLRIQVLVAHVLDLALVWLLTDFVNAIDHIHAL